MDRVEGEGRRDKIAASIFMAGMDAIANAVRSERQQQYSKGTLSERQQGDSRGTEIGRSAKR